MTLEKILEDLIVRKGDKRKVKSIYTPRKFYNFAEGLAKLREADLSTTEGLKTYKRLTGENPEDYSFEETNLRRKTWVSEGNEDLSVYIHAHFNDLVREPDELTREKLALTYCPTKKSRNENYESARKVVAKSKEILEEIENNPKKFLKRNAGSPLMAYYLQAFEGEYFDLKQREAKVSSSLAVRHYGSADFLKTSKEIIDKQYKELEKKELEIQEKISKKVYEKSVKTGRLLSATEEVRLIGSLRKEISKLSERYPDASMRDDLAGNCAGLALKFLKEKYKKPESKD